MYNIERFDDVLRQWTEVFMGRSMRDFSAFMRNHGLSMPQVLLLFRLYYQGQCGVSDIADHLAVTNPAASQTISGRLGRLLGYGRGDYLVPGACHRFGSPRRRFGTGDDFPYHLVKGG